ncbi:thioredoxin family protein [Isachenkonia alkalipeptolytica]|uniref:thioredoxin family protein n=1 Tax=Isachenkonia alkalipeptolytica TaxID=2565777 RepID=UPI00352C77DE
MDEALKRGNLKSEIIMICNPLEFEKYGVTKTPALIINDEIAVEGWVPSIFKMPDILEKFRR